jgi:hypothetical protein
MEEVIKRLEDKARRPPQIEMVSSSGLVQLDVRLLAPSAAILHLSDVSMNAELSLCCFLKKI